MLLARSLTNARFDMKRSASFFGANHRQVQQPTLHAQGVADRVLLGLLPSSTCGWATAVRALKRSGGVLHIHENVGDKEEAQWVEVCLRQIEALARREGRQWSVGLLHKERVKWWVLTTKTMLWSPTSDVNLKSSDGACFPKHSAPAGVNRWIAGILSWLSCCCFIS